MKGKLVGQYEFLVQQDDSAACAKALLSSEDQRWGKDSLGWIWQTRDRRDFVSSNGAFFSVDSSDSSPVAVRWPANARELIVRSRDRNADRQSSFPDSFRAYLAAMKREREVAPAPKTHRN